MAKRSLTRMLLLILLLVAAGLRFYGLNWDGGLGAHPDERYIVGVAEGLRGPHRLNPFEIAPDYAYGHWPLYLLPWFTPWSPAWMRYSWAGRWQPCSTWALCF